MRTRVGYAGGKMKDPTYRRIGDHTEVFQVDYDPKQTTFEKLLDEFWDNHNPCATAWSTQYKAILFYNDDAERKIAEASAAALAKKLRKPVRTEIVKLDRFYFAEDYHQKYTLRNHRALYRNIRSMFASERAFSESTVAMRVNAYLDGHMSYASLKTELAGLGLRAVGTSRLERVEVAPKVEKQKPASKPTSRPTSRPTVR